jgi:hypothetical protein
VGRVVGMVVGIDVGDEVGEVVGDFVGVWKCKKTQAWVSGANGHDSSCSGQWAYRGGTPGGQLCRRL